MILTFYLTINKMPNLRYDYNLLSKYCQENKIILEENYQNKKIIRDTIIKGKCLGEGCQESFEKVFGILCQTGGYCKKCTEKNRIKIIQKNNMVKYGVKWTSQLDTVKEKFKKTSMERYGVDNVAKAIKIKDKIKQTFKEKYGYDNVLQCPEIKERIKQTNLKKYGYDNPTKAPEIQKKVRQTFLKNYGVDNPQKCPEIKEKAKKTNLERYGTEHNFQNKEIKEKSKNTNIKRYGTSYYSQTEECKIKVKKTNLERYGTEYASQNKKIKEKMIETNLKKYGTKYPSQNPEVMERSRKYKFFIFTFPSGKQVKLQGYEKYALRDLLEDGYKEGDIIVSKKEVPRIQYNYQGETHYHFPDFFIPKENKLLEIKSTWTLDIQYDKVMAKMKSALSRGFKYEIWVYSQKGEIQDMIS
jgi:hypothetical protein